MAKTVLEKIERCMSSEEAQMTYDNFGLVPKFSPHHKNPKWISKFGTRNCKQLGAAKNYTHKIVFSMKEGTLDWLKIFETKVNEPNSFKLPLNELINFNDRIVEMCQIVIRRRISKIKGLDECSSKPI